MITSTQWKSLALLVVTFAAGSAGGVAVDRTWLRPENGANEPRAEVGPAGFRGSAGEPARPNGEVEAGRIPYPLEVLKLSPEEQTKLHAIARRWRPQATRAIEGIRANISELENNMFAEMLCVISKEKQDQYLAQLQENGADRILIDKRFALVRSNRCEEATRIGEPQR